MGKSESYDRRINIWINGKEVKNDIASIKGEMFKLQNELARTTRGTKEYNEKAAELKKIKGIMQEHQANVTATGGAWDKLKKSATGGMGIITAGIAGIATAYQSLKGIIFSTDALGDKFQITLGGWKGGLDAMARSLATITQGGLKDLGKKIRDGIEEGRRYAENLDEIDEKTRALQMAEADATVEILKQTEISRSAKYTKDQQIEAGKKIIELEEKLTSIRSGIAEQALLNEIQNIANATKLTEKEIIAFAKREEQMISNMEAGKLYNQMIAERNALDQKAQGELGVLALSEAELKRYEELRKAIADTSEETKRYAKAVLLIPGDEKMQVLADKYVALQQAIGSGLENTMRTRIRTAKNEDTLNKESIKGIKDKTEAENEAAQEWFDIQTEVREYTEKTDEAYFKAIDDKLKKEQEAALESVQIQSDVNEYLAELDDQYFKELEKKKEEKIKYEEEVYAQKRSLLNGFFDLEGSLFDRQFTKLEEQYKRDILAAGNNASAKAKIDAEYDKKKRALARKDAISQKVAALFSIALDTAKGAAKALAELRPVLAAFIVANGALQAATVVATPIPEFATGGFTGPGEKFSPAGIVHKGEYVVNADMVASPQTGPIIQALEQYRLNGLPGYASGGGPGMSTQGSGSTGSAAAIISSDPEMKSILMRIGSLLSDLDSNGVTTRFDYIAVDKIRKGISKLDDIEGSVTI